MRYAETAGAVSAAPGIGWTEVRTGTLRKLWAEGLSASQIAARLGQVTRNAVLGKVHRLGLAGRATTSRNGMGRKSRPRRALTYLTPRPAPVMAAPEALLVALLDLRAAHCRWPIGDPRSDDFAFCGRQKGDRDPYCEHHARIAFQPASRRPRPWQKQH